MSEYSRANYLLMPDNFKKRHLKRRNRFYITCGDVIFPVNRGAVRNAIKDAGKVKGFVVTEVANVVYITKVISKKL